VTRVALFAAGLAGVFLSALALGNVLDVGERSVADAHAEDAPATTEPAHGAGGHAAPEPAGLAVEQDGYRLVQERGAFVAGRAEPYVFRIVGPDGSTVRDFEVEHERRLHLIVVGREPLAAFLHLHPAQRPDGAWTVPLKLPVNGSYRVFADFTTAGERRTLAVDVVGHGGSGVAADPITQYDVDLRRAGERLEFAVRRDGNPVKVQPYLGARGHLVVLREGDLAYIHAHADEDELAFDVPFPSSGRYRLFLQFKVGGRVETARFAVEA
jgi:hypothetical protein